MDGRKCLGGLSNPLPTIPQLLAECRWHTTPKAEIQYGIICIKQPCVIASCVSLTEKHLTN